MASRRRGDSFESHKKKVLCVGNICLDFVNVAREYPEEDSDQRGLDYYWQRGGNASNSCTVLSLLSVPCECLGVMGSHGTEASWIQEDFAKCGIETSHCLMKPVQPSVSTVVISQATGSRTIFHYPRDRPELTYNEFHQIFHGDFTHYSWIHFEAGRSVDYVSHMIDDVVAFNNKHSLPQASDGQRLSVVLSVEIEKPELKNPELVMDKADIVFISKDVAKCKGFSEAVKAVEGLYRFCKNDAVLICAWGDSGAAARYRDITLTAPALADIKVVDTLGAGDTFVAGFVSSLWKHGWTATDRASRDADNITRDADSSGSDVDTSIITNALQYACHLAGLKCTIYGYQGLKQLVSSSV
ncbi:unnamed protein product [Candidula unifasciata]|uniref:Carbohydrate kinase PfkB domain-containing protein n=1 Tax=Candidula unifasciata TaxID=100452 RepID=A0A8S3ZHP2_9EUPU|nr:unnamed protein product [Candidula unifasciata]